MTTGLCKSPTPYRSTVSGLLLRGACLCALASPAVADDMFLPNSLPSSFGDDDNSTSYMQVRSLSNDALMDQAQMMRSDEMSAEHRALNHQWLAIQAGECDELEGSKVLSHIAKKTFREYWRGNRHEFGDNKLLPDDDGHIETTFNDVDYDFKLSGRGIKVGFEFEFQLK